MKTLATAFFLANSAALVALAFNTPVSTIRPPSHGSFGRRSQQLNTPTSLQSTKQTDDENIVKKAYHLYMDYYNRLWSDTDAEHRRRRSRQRAKDAVLHVKNMVSEEYLWENDEKAGSAEMGDLQREAAVFMGMDESVRLQMEEACDLVLDQLSESPLAVSKEDDSVQQPSEPSLTSAQRGQSLPVVNEQGNLISQPHGVSASPLNDTQTELSLALTTAQSNETAVPSTEKTKKKKGRSVLFGATLGASVALWVYSGNKIFSALFTLMTALGQLEYYRMVMRANIYPARRISVVGACATFVTALFAPDLHQIVLPVFSTYAMIWFLTMRRSVTTISEIATTFMGMFYLGYIPSFWVRIRQLGGNVLQPTRLSPIVKPLFQKLNLGKVPKWLPKTVSYPVTVGANFIFWTWLCIAFSDVGGYFAGRKYGKTKLGAISEAAEKTSPNKTVEGVIGGCTFSLVLATLGAWIQKWPYWYVLGPVHGVSLALLGLVGDLTASMLKRDAGMKDFGDLIPEHGGIMDRVDSYIFTAPYGWLVCGYLIPWLRRVADARAAAAVLAV